MGAILRCGFQPEHNQCLQELECENEPLVLQLRESGISFMILHCNIGFWLSFYTSVFFCIALHLLDMDKENAELPVKACVFFQ